MFRLSHATYFFGKCMNVTSCWTCWISLISVFVLDFLLGQRYSNPHAEHVGPGVQQNHLLLRHWNRPWIDFAALKLSNTATEERRRFGNLWRKSEGNKDWSYDVVFCYLLLLGYVTPIVTSIKNSQTLEWLTLEPKGIYGVFQFFLFLFFFFWTFANFW